MLTNKADTFEHSLFNFYVFVLSVTPPLPPFGQTWF